MKILSISTSSSICSVALLENNVLIEELNSTDSKNHSVNLLPLIDDLLKSNNFEISDIDLIACDKGPGSFTGIRIGICTVKAIANVLNIPVIGVSSLEALFYNEKDFNGTVCVLIDAKNNNVYSGIFDKDISNSNYYFDNIDEIIKILQKNSSNIIFIGDGAYSYENIIKNSFNKNVYFSHNNNNNNNNNISSFSLGKCAFDKYSNGITQTTLELLPMYMRKSQAERMKDLNG